MGGQPFWSAERQFAARAWPLTSHVAQTDAHFKTIIFTSCDSYTMFANEILKSIDFRHFPRFLWPGGCSGRCTVHILVAGRFRGWWWTQFVWLISIVWFSRPDVRQIVVGMIDFGQHDVVAIALAMGTATGFTLYRGARHARDLMASQIIIASHADAATIASMMYQWPMHRSQVTHRVRASLNHRFAQRAFPAIHCDWIFEPRLCFWMKREYVYFNISHNNCSTRKRRKAKYGTARTFARTTAQFV